MCTRADEDAKQVLREVWELYALPRISAEAAVGLAQLDAGGNVDINSLASSSSQLLHQLTSDSFRPMREAALAAYADEPLANLVCNVAPEDLQVTSRPYLHAQLKNVWHVYMGRLDNIHATIP